MRQPPRISRWPSSDTPIATSTETLVISPPQPALEVDAVHEDIRVLAADGPFAPVLDLLVNLLVQAAHGGGAAPGTPQELRDVLYAADRYAGKVHLDEGFLDGRFAAPVAFDDGRLEGCQAEFRDGELHFAVVRSFRW